MVEFLNLNAHISASILLSGMIFLPFQLRTLWGLQSQNSSENFSRSWCFAEITQQLEALALQYLREVAHSPPQCIDELHWFLIASEGSSEFEKKF